MNYCSNCGEKIDQNQEVCLECGKLLKPDIINTKDTGGNAGWAVIGFIFPLIGFILYLVWISDYPKRSKAAGLGALSAIFAYLFLVIISIIAVIIAFGTGQLF